MAKLRSLPLCVLASAFLFPIVSHAQQAAPTVRIVNPIDEGQLVTLKGNTPPAAIAKNDRGPVSASLPMKNLVLVLSRSPEQQAAFDAFVASQYDSGSANYHQWLTPAEIGERFGPSQADIGTVSNWLTSHGFAVSNISKDRMSITFNGTAGQVESTFHTQIHNLEVQGVRHIANMTDPRIPAALSPVVVGVKALHDFHPHPLHRLGAKVKFNTEAGKWQRISNAVTAGSSKSAAGATPRPQFGIGVPGNSSEGTLPYLEEDVSPFDFAKIYNLPSGWPDSTNGSGQTIAIVGTSDIDTTDVSNFKSAFGLPAGSTPEEVKGANSIDPGICTSTTALCGIGDLEENSLDVEWSGAVAPGAQIVLVTSGYNNPTNPTNDPIYESAQYVVSNHLNTSTPLVANASILSVSYGLCELGQGTSGNVAYYSLWQSAAAEGISVFVATGDSGSPSCDDGLDTYGNPYSAQYGLSVSGLASTPYNTAVGGTDFSWCQPVYNSSGSAITGCPSSTSSPGPYWNTSNNGTTGASAAGYVPETPWNDTCENPIIAAFLESLAPLTSFPAPANSEAACNYVQNDWAEINQEQEEQSGAQFIIANYVDTVGGSGGASNCVVNTTNPDSENLGSCSTGTASVSTVNGSIPLTNDGWQKPSWQTAAESLGVPNDGVRDIPDVSFFAGDGTLDSATLICVSAIAPCTYSNDDDAFALEVGGTSVATPEMAGVMALINQKAGAPQGLPNAQLYRLAASQTYSECSAESVKASSSCYFNDIDQGTNTMPCDYQGQAVEGGIVYAGGGEWEQSEQYEGLASPNCAALNSGDVVGTLVSSGTTPAYNAETGFDMATGLGSLNIANVLSAWTSDQGTAKATVTATLSATTISADTALTVTVTVTGSSGTPTGSVVVSGGGANVSGTLSGGTVQITIPASTLAPPSDTLTVAYSGDSIYAAASITENVTVNPVLPTVTVTAIPTTQNLVNALDVTVTVSGPLGAPTPTGTVILASGSYSSTAATLLSGGTASFTIPANTLAAGSDTLTATYSGSANYYTQATGTATVMIVSTAPIAPTITVTPSPASIDSSQNLGVTVTVSGTAGMPTGIVSLTYTGSSSALTQQLSANGIAAFTIPGNTLAAGTATLTAAYGGDGTYAGGGGTASVTVTQSAFALSATTPAAVAPGASATSTITGQTSTTGYNGTVTLNTCTLTTPPTNAVNLPTCSVTGTITFASGAPTGTGTATVLTSSNTAMLQTKPGLKGLFGAGGGAVLAFLVFLGIPARRRGWRAMLGALVFLAVLGSLSACGGGINNSGGGSTATTAGQYTFTVSGQGSDPAKTTGSTTFTLTVN